MNPGWLVAGSQPSRTEKNMISSNASQKIGIETPSSATDIERVSSQVLCFSAATTPAMTPSDDGNDHRGERPA